MHSFLTVSMEQKLCLTASTVTLWAPCNMTVNISCNQKSKAERWKVMSMKRSHVLMRGTAVTAAISADNEKKCPYLTFIHKRKEIQLHSRTVFTTSWYITPIGFYFIFLILSVNLYVHCLIPQGDPPDPKFIKHRAVWRAQIPEEARNM